MSILTLITLIIGIMMGISYKHPNSLFGILAFIITFFPMFIASLYVLISSSLKYVILGPIGMRYYYSKRRSGLGI